MKILKNNNLVLKNAVTRVAIATLVVFLLSIVFAFRYKAALTMPNFYAEDGAIFVKNILEHNLLGASLTAFNGYLVVGQYLVAGLAIIPYQFLGLSFSHLPLLIAIASCFFLGLTASLPFILFQRQLGWVVSLVTSILIAFTPMPGSDFAIIGTIGNLKFAFLFWAFLFVIYRNIHHANKYKAYISDFVLLLCIITNGPTVALLPFILWPYRNDLISIIKRRTINIKPLCRPDILSALVLCCVSFLYVAVVYLKGIPEMPNYLQAPYVWAATDNIIYRVTMYSWLFPLSKGMTALTTMTIVAIMLGLVFILNKKGRKVYLLGLVAIAFSTIAFVVTRTGIGEYMLNYEKTPDQFFYAQSMVFVFISMWILAPYVKTRARTIVTLFLAAIFIMSTAPYGSSFGQNSLIYRDRGDIYHNLGLVCSEKDKGTVEIPIYPSSIWTFKVDKKVACK